MNIPTLEVLTDIVSEVSYKNWKFRVKELENGYFLQVYFDALDLETNKLETQYGRKWYISKYMTKSEVVQSCFVACLKAEEHECRESFLYKGSQIFNPHYDVDELHSFYKNSRRDKRAPLISTTSQRQPHTTQSSDEENIDFK